MPEGLISGREYTSARPRGFAPWNPSGDETVQCEALPPDVLAAEVRRAFETVIDPDAIAAVERQETADRARLTAWVESLDE
jgi:hypothetical protein